MNLECPKCGHNFFSNATVRPHCPKCRVSLPRIKTLINGTNGTRIGTSGTISDDILYGNIIEALEIS